MNPQWLSILQKMKPYLGLRTWLILAGALAFLTLSCLRFVSADKYTVENIAWLAAIALVGAMAIAHWWWTSSAPRMEKALQESHYERLSRLSGLYRTIPPEVRRGIKRGPAEEFERTEELIHEKLKNTEPGVHLEDLADLVHNLHLLYLQVAPLDYLAFSMPSLRGDFRQVVSPNSWDAYSTMSSAKSGCPEGSAERESQLRADAMYLVNETRRQSLLKEHVESTRQKLIRSALHGWWGIAIPAIAMLLVYLTSQVLVDLNFAPGGDVPATTAQRASAAETGGTANPADPAKDADLGNIAKMKAVTPDWAVKFTQRYLVLKNENMPSAPFNRLALNYSSIFNVCTACALLALVSLAGATGGMLSVIQRVQKVASESDAMADLRSLSQAETAVFFAPITGVLFAIVLSFIFASKIFTTDIFPKANDQYSWYLALWLPTELAKWLLWAFVAGFSERLVPDMLNTIAQQAADQFSRRPVVLANDGDLPKGTPTPAKPEAREGGAAAAGGAATAPGVSSRPVLNLHPDAIPQDAVEVTLTGSGFQTNSAVFINEQLKPVTALLEITADSLRVRLEPDDLAERTQLTAKVSNPPPGGGETAALTILVAPAGG